MGCTYLRVLNMRLSDMKSDPSYPPSTQMQAEGGCALEYVPDVVQSALQLSVIGTFRCFLMTSKSVWKPSNFCWSSVSACTIWQHFTALPFLALACHRGLPMMQHACSRLIVEERSLATC